MQSVAHVSPYQVTGGQSRCKCMLPTSKNSHTVYARLWIPCVWRMSRHEKHSLITGPAPCHPKEVCSLRNTSSQIFTVATDLQNHRYQIRAIFTSDLIWFSVPEHTRQNQNLAPFPILLKRPYPRS